PSLPDALPISARAPAPPRGVRWSGPRPVAAIPPATAAAARAPGAARMRPARHSFLQPPAPGPPARPGSRRDRRNRCRSPIVPCLQRGPWSALESLPFGAGVQPTSRSPETGLGRTAARHIVHASRERRFDRDGAPPILHAAPTLTRVPMQLSANIEELTGSATLAIASLCREMRAQGLEVLDLSAGEPDFRTPDFAAQAGVAAIEQGFTHY